MDFDFFVVIDFEATCDQGNLPYPYPYPQEIIEFPSVIVHGATGNLLASFQTYVRPTRNFILTDFCKQLTGIEQAQVDNGVILHEALIQHDRWLYLNGLANTKFAIVTWTNWDCKVMLESECVLKGIPKPSYFDRWINLKVPYNEVFGPARGNLKQAVERTGLAWEGRAHCGLDDAKNTARLLSLIMRTGFKLSITDSLASETLGQMPPEYSHASDNYSGVMRKIRKVGPGYWRCGGIRPPIAGPLAVHTTNGDSGDY